jgi:hypothetical protein
MAAQGISAVDDLGLLAVSEKDPAVQASGAAKGQNVKPVAWQVPFQAAAASTLREDVYAHATGTLSVQQGKRLADIAAEVAAVAASVPWREVPDSTKLQETLPELPNPMQAIATVRFVFVGSVVLHHADATVLQIPPPLEGLPTLPLTRPFLEHVAHAYNKHASEEFYSAVPSGAAAPMAGHDFVLPSLHRVGSLLWVSCLAYIFYLGCCVAGWIKARYFATTGYCSEVTTTTGIRPGQESLGHPLTLDTLTQSSMQQPAAYLDGTPVSSAAAPTANAAAFNTTPADQNNPAADGMSFMQCSSMLSNPLP